MYEEIVKYKGEYFECQVFENYYELSNNDKEVKVDIDEGYEDIDTIDESNFDGDVWDIISNILNDNGETTISDLMEQDGREEIINDIRKQVQTLPGLYDKYAKEDIIAALDTSEVYDYYYDLYYLECIRRAFNGYSEEND